MRPTAVYGAADDWANASGGEVLTELERTPPQRTGAGERDGVQPCSRSQENKVKLNPAQVGRAGEFFVAAEIHRRGGYAVTFAGNMPGIDILASDVDHMRQISLQVKTRTAGTWHAQVPRDAQQGPPVPEESAFWAFVDLSGDEPGYYFAPRSWVLNDIFDTHAAFLARHGGIRPHTRDSKHHAITVARIQQWHDRWDVLGIF